MSWKVLSRNSPNFLRAIKEKEEDEATKWISRYGKGFGNPEDTNPEEYLLFEDRKGRSYLLEEGRPIKPMSEITNPLEALSHSSLDFDPDSKECPHDISKCTAKITEQLTIISPYHDLQIPILSFNIAGSKCARPDYDFYLDKPIHKSYSWIRKIEKAASGFPGISFKNHAGLCSKCGLSLRWEENIQRFDNIIPYYCSTCWEKEKLSMKINVFDGVAAQVNAYAFRAALYEAYGRTCQYCAYPEEMDFDDARVEHIIPKSIPLSNIESKLIADGASRTAAHDFCEKQLPHDHDSLINLTLACHKHNWEKLDKLFSPATMELLFRKTATMEMKILEAYRKGKNGAAKKISR